MADRDKAMAELTPQELLIRSNPGVYSHDKELSRDLTNPREMYNILAYKAKSNEDLAARFKQELSKSLNTGAPGLLPKLARTISMNEINRRNPNQFERLGNKPFQSIQSQQSTDKNLDVLVLVRHKTCIADVRKIPEEEKENLRTVNLPNITRNAVSAVGRDDVDYKDSVKRKVDLPGLPEGRAVQAGTPRKKSHLKRKLSGSDSKLDKWFSEMPNEVFDKAQRAIMEESIKDRLHRYQEDRSKKTPTNQHAQVGLGSRYRRLPNTFLEVHVDSFGKHLQNDKDDRMSKYKMQQKSMLKLKMRDIETLETRREKTSHEDMDMMARLALQPRSLTTLGISKTKPSQQQQQQDIKQMQPEVIKIPSDKTGLKTVNMNENVGFDFDAKYSKHCATNGKGNYVTVDDEATTEDLIPAASPPPNSTVGQAHDVDGSSTENHTTKATVLNLMLTKEEPVKRQPLHMEKTMYAVENDIRYGVKPHGEETACDEIQFGGIKYQYYEHETDMKHDKIVTKIPTAKSNRTNDSKSSSSSALSGSKGNKSVLRKFNKLEVFAESNKQAEMKIPRKNYKGQKVREYKEIKDPLPPSVKLDLKNIPHQTKTLIKDDGCIERNEVRRQDVVFRFEPGEVFITTKKNNTTSHSYNNRSSERARIIYGKAMHGKDEKRDLFLRGLDSSRNRFSSSAAMATGRDNRLNDGINIQSGRARDSKTEDSGAEAVNEFLNVKGVLVRDMAIETDMLGSEPNTPRDHLKPPDVNGGEATRRSNSGLSDFIVDNNDGESLESDASDNEEDKTLSDNDMDRVDSD